MEMEPATADFHLPIEVWGKVFQHSEAKDAFNFRLVCSAWRIELDEHFDKWIVRLDQTSPYFQNLLELKVKEATIVDLSTPPVDFGPEDTPRLFQHPEFLEKLSIPYESRICLQNNMMPLLNSCRKTIKELELSVGDVDDDEIFDPDHNLYANGLEFPNLESLALLRVHSSSPTQLIKELTIFKVMVGLSTMTKIKSLRVFISSLHTNYLFSTVLAFIATNGTNLQEIECLLDQPPPPTPADEDDEVPAQVELPATSIDLDLLGQVLRLQKIKINYDGIDFNQHFNVPCETLLEAQRHLTCLHLKPIHISPPSLGRVFYNNQNTLAKIELYDLDFHIDLVFLTGCMHLKELILEGKNFQQEYLVLQNVLSLPVGIQEFESRNYFIDSEYILKLFTGYGELTKIRLDNSGSIDPYGVTAGVIAVLVFNWNLNNKLTDVRIDGFNCSTAGDLAALNYSFRGLEDTWEDRKDFNVQIWMGRTMSEGGDWSGWKMETF